MPPLQANSRSDAQALIRLDEVTKGFGDGKRPAIDALSATVRAGRLTGLVGPDGSGKTTLLRLIAGLLRPDAGTISVAGFDVARQAHRVHDLIGYMPQRFGLYEDLTVLENLNLYADLRGLPTGHRRNTFDRLLAFTDLARFTARLAGALSGGMKQKLGLACALIIKPRLLLLDEPSVGVDPISRRELWRMVRGLVDDEVAVVWSTSYLDEAERCDAVLLLSEGRLLFGGGPQEMTARMAGRTFLVRNLAHDARRRVLAAALERDSVIDGVVQGRHVRLVLAAGATPPGLTEIRASDDAELTPCPPRFEDAFVDLLGGGPGSRSALTPTMPATPGDGCAVVEASGLTKRFGDFTAASGITFSIPRGEIFGLLGPNGAGKSTTFKMLCGLLQPTSGQAQVTGLDLAAAPGEARSQIGYMAQKFSLYGNLSVRQNLAFFSGLYGLSGRRRRERIAQMIEIFGFEPQLRTSVEHLPLGFKQRLALACAVMHGPKVLFLDEPTSGVDPITRREFWATSTAWWKRA